MKNYPLASLAQLRHFGTFDKLMSVLAIFCSLMVIGLAIWQPGQAFRLEHAAWLFGLLILSWTTLFTPLPIAIASMFVVILAGIPLSFFPGYLQTWENFQFPAGWMFVVLIPNTLIDLRKGLFDAAPSREGDA